MRNRRGPAIPRPWATAPDYSDAGPARTQPRPPVAKPQLCYCRRHDSRCEYPTCRKNAFPGPWSDLSIFTGENSR